MAEIVTVAIEFMDGTVTRSPNMGVMVPPTRVADGVLYLRRKDGGMAPDEIVAAYPLCNIRCWWMEDRRG